MIITLCKIDKNNIFVSTRRKDEYATWGEDELYGVTPPNEEGLHRWNNGIWEKIDKYPRDVPQTITKLQAMKQMKAIGKWEAFKTVLANDDDVNDEWVLSDNLNRTYPLVLGIGQLFGFTDADMDNFFIEADKMS